MLPETGRDLSMAVGSGQQNPPPLQINSGKYLRLGGGLVVGGFIGFCFGPDWHHWIKGLLLWGRLSLPKTVK